MADRSPADAASPTAVAADRIQGFYINLDRSTDRRRAIEGQIEMLGIGHIYRRFPAVDGSKLAPAGRMKPGEVGIFRSHHDVLAGARKGGKFIHVLEDDSLLSEFMLPAIELAVGRGMFDRFDVIFTDIGGIDDFRAIRDLKHRYDEIIPFRGEKAFYDKLQLIDLARFNFAAMSSYVVSPAGADRLLAIAAALFVLRQSRPRWSRRQGACRDNGADESRRRRQASRVHHVDHELHAVEGIQAFLTGSAMVTRFPLGSATCLNAPVSAPGSRSRQP
jgi:hypothetical protein